ncbi:MAG: CPBP family intramembrane metalloprotease [Paludibacteraceae bacterium]|nr:CPBP family intramembrane metalloprotease [Paludibacteraceae bacterium]
MINACHQHIHPLLKIAEWLVTIVFCTLAVLAIWYALPFNHASTGALLAFQALQSVGLFIIPPFIVAYLWSELPLQRLHISYNRLNGRMVLLSIAIMLTAIPLINCLVALNGMLRLPESLSGLEQLMQQMEQQAEQFLQRFLTYGDGAWWVLLLNLILLAVLPAIGEELTFRGVLQSFFSNRHVAVWVTAFIFSFIHFQFYGFIPRLLLGAVLGYALVWSGRIGYSMIMHATNNALSVLVFYLGTYVWHLSQDTIDALGTGDTWWLTTLCTPLMVLLLFLFRRSAKES